MKRFLTASTAVLLAALFLFGLCGCEQQTGETVPVEQYTDLAEFNGLTLGISEEAKHCFAGEYHCPAYPDNAEIVIPDTYDGKIVLSLGGNLGGIPIPFCVSVKDLYMNVQNQAGFRQIYTAQDLLLTDLEYTVEEVPFTLRLGKNITQIASINMDRYYPHVNEDRSITFYHPVVNVICDEQNFRFLSQDGKLYNRNSGVLVDDFAYPGDSALLTEK